MKIKIINDAFLVNKKIVNLDTLVLDFVSKLDELNIRYVIISGYVAIIFGRSRNSEDIDLFIEKINYDTFEKLWQKLYFDFECIIEDDIKEAFYEYLNQGLPLRFSKKNTFIPNMEIKFAKDQLDLWSIKNRKKVIFNNKYTIYISPLELQIPYKLFLSSEKDIEDAKHIYNRFKNKLDYKLFNYFLKELKMEYRFRKYLL